jgi:transposase
MTKGRVLLSSITVGRICKLKVWSVSSRGVERLVKRLKQCRRIAICDEKRAENYDAMVTITAIVLW